MKQYKGMCLSVLVMALLTACGTAGGGGSHFVETPVIKDKPSGSESTEKPIVQEGNTLQEPTLAPKTKIDIDYLKGWASYRHRGNSVKFQTKYGEQFELEGKFLMAINFSENKVEAGKMKFASKEMKRDDGNVRIIGAELSLKPTKLKQTKAGGVSFDGKIGTFTYKDKEMISKGGDFIAKSRREMDMEEAVNFDGVYTGHLSGSNAEKVDVSFEAHGGGMSLSGEVVADKEVPKEKQPVDKPKTP